jgi:predicted RNA-binding protein YlxR (DUF448 family)
MSKGGHRPVRMCAGCRTRRPKVELARLALDGEGGLCVDEKKIRPGRGVYVCPCSECLELAIKRKGLVRGFRGRFRQGVPERVLSVFREEKAWQK